MIGAWRGGQLDGSVRSLMADSQHDPDPDSNVNDADKGIGYAVRRVTVRSDMIWICADPKMHEREPSDVPAEAQGSGCGNRGVELTLCPAG